MNTAEREERRLQYVLRLEDPPVAQSLFESVRWSWIWLILRVYAGWQWASSGAGKIGADAWTGDNAGAAITGFVTGALEQTGGAHPNVQGWYAWFLENVVSPTPPSELYGRHWRAAGGVALIVGLFTGIAAFWRLHEHELPARRYRQHQSHPPDHRHLPHPRLEDRRLVGA